MPMDQDGPSARFGILVSMLATLFSLLRTGHNFGFSNNNFHIPIVLRFAEMPQFAADAVVQSLTSFVSPVYPALALVADEGNIEAVFFAGLVLTHFLTFLGMLRVAMALGLCGRGAVAAFVLLLVPLNLLYGVSWVGRDGMLTDYFSHTELARAVALFVVAKLLRRRMLAAGLLAGIAFALNAFIGIWLLVPAACIAVWHVLRDDGQPDDNRRAMGGRLRDVVLGGVAFAIPALPVAVWIAVTLAGTDPGAPFDYPAFLRGYYPFHFFLDASPGFLIVQLGFAMLAGVLASFALARGRGASRLVLLALIGLFMAGVLAGMVASSRTVLNLHLLRVDGLIVFLAVCFVMCVVFEQVRAGSVIWLVAAAGAYIGLSQGEWWVSAAAMALLLAPSLFPALEAAQRRLPADLAMLGRVLPLAGFVLAAASAVASWDQRRHPLPPGPGGAPLDMALEGAHANPGDWIAVAEWARRETPPHSIFLLPPELSGFRARAQRRVWVGWKDGATAMWAPATWAEWNQRLADVRGLAGPEQALRYACAHHIDFVVLDLRPRRGEPAGHLNASPAPPAFHNRWFEVRRPSCG